MRPSPAPISTMQNGGEVVSQAHLRDLHGTLAERPNAPACKAGFPRFKSETCLYQL